ncbi:TetR/AcrR family transcriptional regulator [Variovorax terrae]|uniref:TetR/AcrR family transcriptional regulator n=1 Tax=Variovorax terrae TaxID=2923278 RepID=A0A9X2AP10_9BURK|nr:TetR/AcrR family transcriptional regulator [Variovorax terrae]MCJ0762967.1 TetR/AcrR family transcriptional regulator [Variovorax terrae]
MIVNMASPGRRRNAPKSAYHHGDLPRALVDAAQQLIEAGGGARLTLREAAQAAGVSVAAPYRHFADREALLAAVLAKGFRELAHRTDEDRRAASDAMAGLMAVGLAYVRFAADHPAIYRLMFGAECDKAAHPDLMAAGHEALTVLIEAVATCKAAGLIGDADVQQVALAGWSLSHGLASLHADGLLAAAMPGDLQATAHALMRMLIDGVRPRPG